MHDYERMDQVLLSFLFCPAPHDDGTALHLSLNSSRASLIICNNVHHDSFTLPLNFFWPFQHQDGSRVVDEEQVNERCSVTYIFNKTTGSYTSTANFSCSFPPSMLRREKIPIYVIVSWIQYRNPGTWKVVRKLLIALLKTSSAFSHLRLFMSNVTSCSLTFTWGSYFNQLAKGLLALF